MLLLRVLVLRVLDDEIAKVTKVGFASDCSGQ